MSDSGSLPMNLAGAVVASLNRTVGVPDKPLTT